MKIILLGPPGSGKGTVAKKIHQDYNLPIISTGVILRNAISNGSELGKKVEKIMNVGDLVPDDLILEIIKERMMQDDCLGGYILDGFPRNTRQAVALEKMLEETSQNIDYVFYFKIDFDEIVKRLSNRRVCRQCGLNYNLITNSPKNKNKCDTCGGELFQREDDKESTIKNRLNVYNEQTFPLKVFYENRKLLKIVDASLNEKDFYELLRAVLKS